MVCAPRRAGAARVPTCGETTALAKDFTHKTKPAHNTLLCIAAVSTCTSSSSTVVSIAAKPKPTSKTVKTVATTGGQLVMVAMDAGVFATSASGTSKQTGKTPTKRAPAPNKQTPEKLSA